MNKVLKRLEEIKCHRKQVAAIETSIPKITFKSGSAVFQERDGLIIRSGSDYVLLTLADADRLANWIQDWLSE